MVKACTSQGSPEKQTNKISRDIEKKFFCEGLIHAIMEAIKSHDLLSASERLRKGSDIVPV